MSLEQRLVRLAARWNHAPERCFGAEARAAYRLGIAGDQPPFQRFMLRPPLEPIVFSYWARFRSRAFTPVVATNLVSALCGAPTKPRTSTAVTRAAPGAEPSWVYPEGPYAADWLDRLYALDPNALPPLRYAGACFAEAVRSHPYPNGNGRLGRAFLHGALAETAGLGCPFMPLGPVMYAHTDKLVAGLRAITESGSWTAFHAAMDRILSHALDLCEADLESTRLA